MKYNGLDTHYDLDYFRRDFAIIDTEGYPLSSERTLREIGIVNVSDGKIVGEYSFNFNNVTLYKAYDEIKKIIGKRTLVFFDAMADIARIEHDLDLICRDTFKNRVFCIQEFYHNAFDGSAGVIGLDDTLKKMNIGFVGSKRHLALYDAQLTAELFLRIDQSIIDAYNNVVGRKAAEAHKVANEKAMATLYATDDDVVTTQYVTFSNGVTVEVPATSEDCRVSKNNTTHRLMVRKNDILHNEAGPAIVAANDNGVISVSYFLNGKEYTKENWQNKVSKTKTEDNPAVANPVPAAVKNSVVDSDELLRQSLVNVLGATPTLCDYTRKEKTLRVPTVNIGKFSMFRGALHGFSFEMKIQNGCELFKIEGKDILVVLKNGTVHNDCGPAYVTIVTDHHLGRPANTRLNFQYNLFGYSVKKKIWQSTCKRGDYGVNENTKKFESITDDALRENTSKTVVSEPVMNKAPIIHKNLIESRILKDNVVSTELPTGFYWGGVLTYVETASLSDNQIMERVKERVRRNDLEGNPRFYKVTNGYLFTAYGWYVEMPNMNFQTHTIHVYPNGFEIVKRSNKQVNNPLGYAVFMFDKPSYIEYIGHPTLSGRHFV